jgi:hypothetical protein
MNLCIRPPGASAAWPRGAGGQWAPYYLRLRERGLSSTAASVALSRKLAKVCFALLRTNTPFVPAVCNTT